MFLNKFKEAYIKFRTQKERNISMIYFPYFQNKIMKNKYNKFLSKLKLIIYNYFIINYFDKN